MAAEEDELLDAEERAEEQARLENEALAAEAKAAGEELKKLMKNANRQDTAKLQVIPLMILRSDLLQHANSMRNDGSICRRKST